MDILLPAVLSDRRQRSSSAGAAVEAWKISDRDLFHLSQWSRAQARKRAPRDLQQSQPNGDAAMAASHPELMG